MSKQKKENALLSIIKGTGKWEGIRRIGCKRKGEMKSGAWTILFFFIFCVAKKLSHLPLWEKKKK